jgi:hypothetical protein
MVAAATAIGSPTACAGIRYAFEGNPVIQVNGGPGGYTLTENFFGTLDVSDNAIVQGFFSGNDILGAAFVVTQDFAFIDGREDFLSSFYGTPLDFPNGNVVIDPQTKLPTDGGFDLTYLSGNAVNVLPPAPGVRFRLSPGPFDWLGSVFGDGTVTASVTIPVPEPGTIVLGGLALACAFIGHAARRLRSPSTIRAA